MEWDEPSPGSSDKSLLSDPAPRNNKEHLQLGEEGLGDHRQPIKKQEQ